MSRQLQEIESILRQLIDEHRTLLTHVDAQQLAMRAGKPEQIDHATYQQDATRLRIAKLESKRRQLAVQIGRAMRMDNEPTVSVLAQLFPARSDDLLKLRDELRETMRQVSDRTHIVSRMTNAVLGHLNSAVRIIAGAVEQAGVYTKSGAPQIVPRIGVMEAVG